MTINQPTDLDDDQPARAQKTAARLKVGVANGNCKHLLTMIITTMITMMIKS